MDHKMSSQEWAMFNYEKKRIKPYVDNRYYCKCGHSVTIMPTNNKILCTHCGHWVFKDKKEEFKYRIKEKLL